MRVLACEDDMEDNAILIGSLVSYLESAFVHPQNAVREQTLPLPQGQHESTDLNYNSAWVAALWWMEAPLASATALGEDVPRLAGAKRTYCSI